MEAEILKPRVKVNCTFYKCTFLTSDLFSFLFKTFLLVLSVGAVSKDPPSLFWKQMRCYVSWFCVVLG